MAMIEKTKAKGPKSAEPVAPDASPGLSSGKGVRVTPGAGGHKLGTLTKCASKRAAPNVREGAY